jgi:hypothetical protein
MARSQRYGADVTDVRARLRIVLANAASWEDIETLFGSRGEARIGF